MNDVPYHLIIACSSASLSIWLLIDCACSPSLKFGVARLGSGPVQPHLLQEAVDRGEARAVRAGPEEEDLRPVVDGVHGAVTLMLQTWRHLSEQITDKAIAFIDRQRHAAPVRADAAAPPPKPFFLYYAPGACSQAPH